MIVSGNFAQSSNCPFTPNVLAAGTQCMGVKVLGSVVLVVFTTQAPN
jgi:hypothetical protein